MESKETSRRVSLDSSLTSIMLTAPAISLPSIPGNDTACGSPSMTAATAIIMYNIGVVYQTKAAMLYTDHVPHDDNSVSSQDTIGIIKSNSSLGCELLQDRAARFHERARHILLQAGARQGLAEKATNVLIKQQGPCKIESFCQPPLKRAKLDK